MAALQTDKEALAAEVATLTNQLSDLHTRAIAREATTTGELEASLREQTKLLTQMGVVEQELAEARRCLDDGQQRSQVSCSRAISLGVPLASRGSHVI